MTTSKRLAAFRAAQSSDDEPEITPDRPDETEEIEVDSSKQKDTPMTTETDQAALDTARAEGFTAANARFNTVLASEHYAGREALAKALLANEKLGADEIVAALEAAPKAAVEAPQTNNLTDEQRREAAEEGGRKEMQDALNANGNSNLNADGGGLQDKAAQAGASWDRAYDRTYGKPAK